MGGRPSYNPYNLLAAIIYCFAFSKASLRDIEDNCKYDLRLIYIMNNQIPSYKTIGNFINKIVVPNRIKIFALITNQIFKECKLNMDKAYIDGTKIEANANKYKFVWKPTTFHINLTKKIIIILSKYGLNKDLPNNEILSSQIIAKKITEFYNKYCQINLELVENKEYKKDLKLLSEFLNKSLEYEEKERICGPNRNSYYKTDKDATAMCLKSDYYSKLGTNMHAAYNIQICVANGLITSYLTTQSRTDFNDFIPLLNRHYSMYSDYPKNICADAGYGILCNYRYLNINGINNFIKHSSWDGNVTGRNPSRYILINEKEIKCLNGNSGFITNDNMKSRKKENKLFKITGCNNCNFRFYCKRYMKKKDEDYRYFEVDIALQKYIFESEQNLKSKVGIEMRVNRSSQVEGAFGVIKQDMNYNRFRRVSIEKVETEFMLTALGYNVRKLFKYYNNVDCFTYWKAPENLSEEKFKKPSYKRLTNKVNKKGCKI